MQAITVAAEHWYSNGTVIGITGVAIGIVAIIVAVILWRLGAPRGLLEYNMPVSIALVSRSPRLRENDLQITLRGKVVQNPYLATVNIANRGNRDIRSNDFDQENPLILNLGTRILDILSSSDSGDEPFNFSEGDDQIQLSPMLIRRKQQITIDILTEGEPTLTCNDTLADVKIRRKPKDLSSPIMFVITTVTATITAIGLIMLVLGKIYFWGALLSIVGVAAFVAALRRI